MAFTISGPIPGYDAPAMTFSVYPLPSGIALSAQTVLASGVSSQQARWSSAEPRTHDVSRYGPLMLTVLRWILEIARWWLRACRAVHIGLRHIPVRRLLIRTQRSAFSCITHGFWSSSGHRCCEPAAGRRVDVTESIDPVSLQRMYPTEMLNLALGQVVFPSQEVAALSPAPRAPRAAPYMSAMG